jgi:ribosomal-protein-serine acetyltransferase
MNDIKIDPKKVELTDGIIVLRPYRKSDLKGCYEAIIESRKEISAWLPFAQEGYSLNDTRDWIKTRPANWKSGQGYEFAIIDAKDGRIIGGCGLNDISRMDQRCNLGYWVRTSDTGRGVAPAAAKLLAKWGFDVLKLNRIEIVVAVENARSLGAAAKAGAQREGVLRNRLVLKDTPHDAVMHSLIPGEV